MTLQERDCVLVSKNSNGDTVLDFPATRINCVEGAGRIPGTSYKLGDVALCVGSNSLQLLCTTAGTTATTDLDISTCSEGDSITDGTVVWSVIKRTYKAELNAAEDTLAAYGVRITTVENNLAPLIFNNAAAHNSIYRGKYLGSSVTTAQWAAIKAGTFEDLYIGDYWTINGVDYVIMAFDYYLNTPWSQMCSAHHATLIPRKNLYAHVMNDTNVVTGGYVGSKMYASGLDSAKTTIANAFGSSHLLTIKLRLTNATNSQYGYGTTAEWYDQTVYLMSEVAVYGNAPFTEFYRGQNWGTDHYSTENSQFPGFVYDKTLIHTHEDYWLRNVADSAGFAFVSGHGDCNYSGASSSRGVRPAFNIYQS